MKKLKELDAEIKASVENRYNITLLSDVDDSKDNDLIIYKCNTCGTEYTKSLAELRRTRSCIPCESCNRHNHFENELNKKYSHNTLTVNKMRFVSNRQDPIEVTCSRCGNTYETTYDLLMRGHSDEVPCKFCTKLKLTNKYAQGYVKAYSVNDLYDLLNKIGGNYEIHMDDIRKYTAGDKIKLKCLKCNYEFSATVEDILIAVNRKVRKCPRCNKKERKTEDETIALIESSLPIKVLEFNGKSEPIKCKCLKCGKDSFRFYSNIFTSGCKYCTGNGTSHPDETEIRDYLLSLDKNLKIIENDRNILDGKYELDLLIPSKNIAIEYDGLYYHADSKKGFNYHINKTQECAKKGIRLIHIFEDEWLYKQNIVKAKLKHILGYDTTEKVYARKCAIRVPQTEEVRTILNENHIQGFFQSSIKLGLYYEDRLVAVMTFGNYRKALGRLPIEGEYELLRYATSVNVVGGFSKLLKYFITNYNPKKIITYADLRWTAYPGVFPNVYERNGFKMIHISEPNYFYCKDQHRYGRFTFRKSELKNRFPDIYDDKLTEFQIMDKTSYTRVFDCGNILFEYDLKNNA